MYLVRQSFTDWSDVIVEALGSRCWVYGGLDSSHYRGRAASAVVFRLYPWVLSRSVGSQRTREMREQGIHGGLLWGLEARPSRKPLQGKAMWRFVWTGRLGLSGDMA